MKLIRAAEQERIAAIESVYGTVLSILGENGRGAGSGVIFDHAGFALTNHHVVAVVGKKGKAGMSNGRVYPWTLVGTDPAGDIAIIQLSGRDEWPVAKLGDSASVQMGDWVMAMGNPFGLAEDHSPTVTLGIVSGVERYQGGGMVYGNCIQVDCAINPGNSGGPLFNMRGEVIGINGRAAFAERGRVNVGVGFAVSANQISNFLPDLLATKVAQHGTLDAQFEMREGRVICTSINLDSRAARAGLELGDELLSVNGIKIATANQLANFLATLPNQWPVHLIYQRAGKEKSLSVRLSPLTYAVRSPAQEPKRVPEGKEEPKRDRKQRKRSGLPRLRPGQLLSVETNRGNADKIIEQWQSAVSTQRNDPVAFEWTDEVRSFGGSNSTSRSCYTDDGRFLYSDEGVTILRNASGFFKIEDGIEATSISIEEALSRPGALAVAAMAFQYEASLSDILGVPELDGSDFVDDQLAIRLRFNEKTERPFYIWLTNESSHSLLKAGFDEDGTVTRPAVTFASSVRPQDDGAVWADHRRQVLGVRAQVQKEWISSDFRVRDVP
ncbi:MAG: trypsin-like peptidase domain-containing protein, partial [Planctomycetota bacterium]